MRREGSPFQGLGTVFVKELSDNMSSVRMLVLELLIVLTALAALYGAIDNLRQNTARIRSCSCGCSHCRARRCRPLSPSWASSSR